MSASGERFLFYVKIDDTEFERQIKRIQEILNKVTASVSGSVKAGNDLGGILNRVESSLNEIPSILNQGRAEAPADTVKDVQQVAQTKDEGLKEFTKIPRSPIVETTNTASRITEKTSNLSNTFTTIMKPLATIGDTMKGAFKSAVGGISGGLGGLSEKFAPIVKPIESVNKAVQTVTRGIDRITDNTGKSGGLAEAQEEQANNTEKKETKRSEGLLGKISGIANGILPLIGIAVSIGSLLALVIQASPMLRSVLSLLNTGILFILRPIGDFIGFLLRPVAILFLRFALQFYKDVFPTIKAIGEAGGTALANFFKDPLGSLMGFGQWLWDQLGKNPIITALMPLPTTIKSILEWIMNLKMPSFEDIGDSISGAFNSIDWSAIKAPEWLQGFIDGTASFLFDTVPTTVIDFFNNLIDWATNVGYPSLVEGVTPVVEFFNTLIDWAKNVGFPTLVDALGGVGNFFLEIINWATNVGFPKFVVDVEEWFTKLINTQKLLVELTLDVIWGAWDGMMKAIQSGKIAAQLALDVVFGGAWDSFVKFLTEDHTPRAYGEEAPKEAEGIVSTKEKQNKSITEKWNEMADIINELVEKSRTMILPKWQQLADFANTMSVYGGRARDYVVNMADVLRKGYESARSMLSKLGSVSKATFTESAISPQAPLTTTIKNVTNSTNKVTSAVGGTSMLTPQQMITYQALLSSAPATAATYLSTVTKQMAGTTESVRYAAAGMNEIVNSPTMIHVAEREAEMVNITPISKMKGMQQAGAGTIMFKPSIDVNLGDLGAKLGSARQQVTNVFEVHIHNNSSHQVTMDEIKSVIMQVLMSANVNAGKT